MDIILERVLREELSEEWTLELRCREEGVNHKQEISPGRGVSKCQGPGLVVLDGQ